MNRLAPLQMAQSQKGSVTVDFLFAITLVGGLTSILFALSLTLTVSSIAQYMTYAAARNLYAAHLDSGTQGDLAKKKFVALQEDPVLAPLFGGGWFSLENAQFYGKPGDLQSYRPEFKYEGTLKPGEPDLFVGFAVTLYARILDFNLPFFGPTSNEGDGSGSGFGTQVGSFLSKEPSSVECLRFNQERWRAIRNLNVGGGFADYASQTPEENYIVMGDNGC